MSERHSKSKKESDPWGQAIYDYVNAASHKEAVINVLSPDFDEDSIALAHLFRAFPDMPAIEQQALQQCRGRVLDIGSGAGSHTLYLQNQGIDVTSLDHSALAIKAQKKRGVQQALCYDIHQFELTEKKGERATHRFDTLLMLMNGIGIVGQLKGLSAFLEKAKTWLNPGGQCLLDSSDIHYLFDDALDEHIETNIETNTLLHAETHPLEHPKYYGELTYQFAYKTETSAPFPWLFIDYSRLHKIALECGWQCEKVCEGEHHDYLARLSPL